MDSAGQRCGRGHADVVERLLKAGADANRADVKGMTALMRAAEGGHVAVASLLLAAKANVEHSDKKGKTALMRAAENRVWRWSIISSRPEQTPITLTIGERQP